MACVPGAHAPGYYPTPRWGEDNRSEGKTDSGLWRLEPEQLRVEPGQQLLDARNLRERSLFARSGEFPRLHELREVELCDVGCDHHVRGAHADVVEVVVLYEQATKDCFQCRRRLHIRCGRVGFVLTEAMLDFRRHTH